MANSLPLCTGNHFYFPTKIETLFVIILAVHTYVVFNEGEFINIKKNTHAKFQWQNKLKRNVQCILFFNYKQYADVIFQA